MNEPGALTNCRAQRRARVRTAKEIQRAGVTHVLPNADRGTCQHMKRNPASQGHSRTAATASGRGRDTSRQRMKDRGRGALTSCRVQRRDAQPRKASKRGALTSCQAKTEGQVSTARESERARNVHQLSTEWKDGSEQLNKASK